MCDGCHQKNCTITMPADEELYVPTTVSTLDANGELHKNELTNAKPKVQKMTVGQSPTYRNPPKVSSNFNTKQTAFQNDFANFKKSGF